MRPSLYFPYLHYLRGFAALSVLVYPVIGITNWKNFPSFGTLLWFRFGWMSVEKPVIDAFSPSKA